jgi:hypothetical protein
MRPKKRYILKYESSGRKVATILLRSILTAISYPAWLLTVPTSFAYRASKDDEVVENVLSRTLSPALIAGHSPN